MAPVRGRSMSAKYSLLIERVLRSAHSVLFKQSRYSKGGRVMVEPGLAADAR
jgi:hypothetical protein